MLPPVSGVYVNLLPCWESICAQGVVGGRCCTELELLVKTPEAATRIEAEHQYTRFTSMNPAVIYTRPS